MVTLDFCKKQCLPLITCNKKHLLKKVNIHTEQTFFVQLLLLKVCESFLLRQSKKTCSILWSAQIFFSFLGKREENLIQVNLFLYIKNVGCVFGYLCGVQKIHLSVGFKVGQVK